MTIAAYDEGFCSHCWLKVAVYGYRSSQFVLSVTSSLGSRVLQDGVPVSDTVGTWQYE